MREARQWLQDQRVMHEELSALNINMLARSQGEVSENYFIGYLQGHIEELRESLAWLESSTKLASVMKWVPFAMPFVASKRCAILFDRFYWMAKAQQAHIGAEKHRQGYYTARVDTIKRIYAAACHFHPQCMNYGDMPSEIVNASQR